MKTSNCYIKNSQCFNLSQSKGYNLFGSDKEESLRRDVLRVNKNLITLSSPYHIIMIRPDLITLSYHPTLKGDDKDEEVGR